MNPRPPGYEPGELPGCSTPRKVYQNIFQLKTYSSGGPGRIRTCDLRIRSPLLYPAELRAPLILKSEWQDLNLRPRAPKARALPPELHSDRAGK